MTLSHCLYDIWFPKLNLQAIMSGCQSEFCEYMFDVAGIDFTLFLCYTGQYRDQFKWRCFKDGWN